MQDRGGGGGGGQLYCAHQTHRLSDASCQPSTCNNSRWRLICATSPRLLACPQSDLVECNGACNRLFHKECFADRSSDALPKCEDCVGTTAKLLQKAGVLPRHRGKVRVYGAKASTKAEQKAKTISWCVDARISACRAASLVSSFSRTSVLWSHHHMPRPCPQPA